MKKNNIGLVVQTVLAVAVLMFSILYLMLNEILIVLQVLTSLFMFVLAYNNHTVFKRNKWYTIAYITVGILILGGIFF